MHISITKTKEGKTQRPADSLDTEDLIALQLQTLIKPVYDWEDDLE